MMLEEFALRGVGKRSVGEKNVFHIGVLILNHSCVVEAIQFSSANCDFKYN